MSEPEKKNKKEWYHTCWGIALIILFLLPFAIWWVWAKSNWTPTVKWVVTGIIGFFLLIGIISSSVSAPTPLTTTTIKPSAIPSLSAEEEAAAKKKAEEDKAKAEADAKAKAEAEKELDAEVKFNNVAFMIKNKEAKNWTGCKFVLNGKLFGSDYTFNSSEGIVAGDSIIVPMNEFTKSDGTRFNPYSTKAKNIFIACEVEGIHRTGYYAISQ